MKTFKYIIGFFLLTVLFKASVSAENVSVSENTTTDSVEKTDNVKAVSHQGISIFIDTETESIISGSQPDILPLSFEDTKVKINGLHQRSQDLSNVQNCKFQIYDCECFNKYLTKELIYPFHSFW